MWCQYFNYELVLASHFMTNSKKHVITRDGATYHYYNQELHRDDGPAVIGETGYKAWFKHGIRHRDDGPAVIHPSGYVAYYKNGKFHRDDGPAQILPHSKKKSWYKDGVLHRIDGPAIEYQDGTAEWFQDGLCHREDGPARIVSPPEYFLEGWKLYPCDSTQKDIARDVFRQYLADPKFDPNPFKHIIEEILDESKNK